MNRLSPARLRSFLSDFHNSVPIRCLFITLSLCLSVFPQAVQNPTDFGQVAVKSSAFQVLSFSFTGLSQPPVFTLQFGVDFSADAPTCTPDGSSCTVAISFSPQYPGLRQDAIVVKNSSGALVARRFLHGLGLGPQAAFAPGVIRTILPPNLGGSSPSPGGAVVDPAGFVFVSDRTMNVILKVSPTDLTRRVYAGISDYNGHNTGDGGPATSATLLVPRALALNAAGDLYINSGDVIRQVNAATGVIDTVAGLDGGSDSDGIPARTAALHGVCGLAVNATGDLYICEIGRIRKVDASTGVINTVAGSRASQAPYGDGGLAVNTQLGQPLGIALDSAGDLYIADYLTDAIRKVTFATGIITTVAGAPYQIGYNPNQGSGQPATSVKLYQPSSVAVDAAGDVYIAESSFIRKVSAATGLISTVAGGNSPLVRITASTPLDGYPANAVGMGTSFLGIDGAGNLYVNNLELVTSGTTLLYGSTSVGQTSAAQTVSIENIGNQTLALTQVQLGPNFVKQDSGARDCSASGILNAGGECSVAIAFQPLVSNAPASSLVVTDNSLNGIAVQQQGTLRGPWGTAFVSTTSQAFETLPVGQSSIATIRVSNFGTTPVTIGLTMEGPNAADFSIDNNTCTFVLAAQSSCSFWVNFVPKDVGPRSASLVVSSSADQSTQSISLTGTATPTPRAQVSLSADSLSFQQQSGVSQTQTVTLTNTGNSALVIQSVKLRDFLGAGFSFGGTCQYPNLTTWPAGSSCTILVTFRPPSVGQIQNALIITDNAPGSPHTIPLSGYGATSPGLTASSSNLSFSQNLNGIATAKFVTIANTTESAINLDRISFGGPAALDYVQSNNCKTVLAVGDTCAVLIGFSPRLLGARTASLVIMSNGLETDVSLAGTGTLPTQFKLINSATGKALVVSGLSDGSLVYQSMLKSSPDQLWSAAPTGSGSFQIYNAASRKALDVLGGSDSNGALIQQYSYFGYENQQWTLEPVGNAYYKIVNRQSGKVLDVPGGSTADGSYVQQWDFNGSQQQLWILAPATPYHVANSSSKKVLSVSGNSTANGAFIEQSSMIGLHSQQWQLIPAEAGYFSMVNLGTGKALDVTHSSSANGGSIQQYEYLSYSNQQWQIVPVDSDGNYKIVNRLSGKVLDDPGFSTADGTPIQQWEYLGGTNQLWRFSPINVVRIQNAGSIKVLDVPGGDTNDHLPIQQWTANGSPQQYWQVISLPNQYALIVNALTEKCLEVPNGSTNDGAPVQQSTYSGTDNQQWQLVLSRGPYEIVNKQTGKALDIRGASLLDGAALQQYQFMNGSNQLWYVQ